MVVAEIRGNNLLNHSFFLIFFSTFIRRPNMQRVENIRLKKKSLKKKLFRLVFWLPKISMTFLRLGTR